MFICVIIDCVVGVVLEEDVFWGDFMSMMLFLVDVIVIVDFVVCELGVFSGGEVFVMVFVCMDLGLMIDLYVVDGDEFVVGDVLVLVLGVVCSIFIVECVVFNFV